MKVSLGILAISLFPAVLVACGVYDHGSMEGQTTRSHSPVLENPQIDYAGFAQLTRELQPVRDKRRVSIKEFNEMAKDKHTIILDTRSQAAFDEIHVAGAIHLNFSDFTAGKLAKVIPNKNTRILIYCNNNFAAENTPALALKSVRLALNIPTFVNLHGYGYTNVYELADVLALTDPRLDWAGQRSAQRQADRQFVNASR